VETINLEWWLQVIDQVGRTKSGRCPFAERRRNGRRKVKEDLCWSAFDGARKERENEEETLVMQMKQFWLKRPALLSSPLISALFQTRSQLITYIYKEEEEEEEEEGKGGQVILSHE